MPLQRERRHIDGLAVTRPELTLFHLAASLDGEALEAAFESARRQRLVTTTSVEACVQRVAVNGRGGAEALRELILDIGAASPCESVLEVKVARLLRHAHVLAPVRQYEIGRYRVDFAWPDRRVVLECDGERYHTDFQHDRTKWSAIAAAGYRVLVVTWDDVTQRNTEVERQVRAALSFAA